MIGEVLIFLREHLNAYLNAQSVLTPGGDTGEDKVVFVDGDKMDPITFKLGAVSTLLINVEEDNTLRPADPFTVVSANGTHRKAKPEICMNLYVLFVARFKLTPITRMTDVRILSSSLISKLRGLSASIVV